MTATADITVKKVENAILIPSAALRFTPPVTGGEKDKSSTSLVGSLLPRPPRPGTETARGYRQTRSSSASGH